MREPPFELSRGLPSEYLLPMQRLTLKTFAERCGRGCAGVVGAALVLLSPVRALGRADGAGDDVRAVVAEILAGAESRSSLIESGSAGHETQKFFVAGKGLRLTIGGILQTRYILNFREQSPGTDGFDTGFQRRRLKLSLSAEIEGGWRGDVTARFLSSGEAETETLAIVKSFEEGWQVKLGQFRTQLVREEGIVDSRQQAVERSVSAFVFGQGYPQGVEVSSTGDRVRFLGVFSDGLRSENTDFDAAQRREAEYALTARVDLLLGAPKAWKRFDELSPRRGGEVGALLGGAVHWQQSPNTSDVNDTDRNVFEYTADVLVQGDSWNVFGAFIGRLTQFRGSVPEVGFREHDANDFGSVVQGAWRVGENWDVFGRWDAVYFNSGFDNGDAEWNFVTFGGNYCFADHAAKLSADVVWSVDDTAGLQSLGVLPNTSLGLLGSAEKNEVVARVQLQLVF